MRICRSNFLRALICSSLTPEYQDASQATGDACGVASTSRNFTSRVTVPGHGHIADRSLHLRPRELAAVDIKNLEAKSTIWWEATVPMESAFETQVVIRNDAEWVAITQYCVLP